MASHPNYVKKKISIDTVSWTPVVAAIDCMGVAIKNTAAADIKIRTDSADGNTEDLIPAGNQDGVMVGRFGDTPATSRSGPRFFSGETVAFLQAVSGTGPALATFVA
jgi:hypothetical protein